MGGNMNKEQTIYDLILVLILNIGFYGFLYILIYYQELIEKVIGLGG